MKKVEILLITLTVSACATQTPQQTTQIQGVGDPNEIQKAPTTIERAAVTPELPELKEEENIEPEKELTFHEKIERIFHKGCVIDIETYDVSEERSLENGNKIYPPNSTITVVAVWDSLTNKKCGVRIDENSKIYHQIVHEEEDGIIALDFMRFSVVTDRYGYDRLHFYKQGPSIKKEEADKINWNRIDKINFYNIRYGERLYWGKLFHPIHKSMKDRIYKRWEEK